MKVFEEHHNEPEQVEAYLRGALALVEELEPPADLREATFTKAVDLLSAKTLQVAPASGLAVPPSAMGGNHG
jgi:hypothetical protein